MCLRICGHDKSAPTPADGLQQRCEQIAIYTRTPTKCPQNIPPGVGADSSRPYPNITKYTYPHYQIRISTLPHTHFPSHFVCVYVYTGTINRTPTAADGLQQCCEQIAIYTHTPTKHHTFAPQTPYFYTTKTILLHHKNHTFTPQIPTFRTANTYRRQIGRVAKTFC